MCDILLEKLRRIWKFWCYLTGWECNRFHIMRTSAIHIISFLTTYLGRISRESAPLYRISRTIVPHHILAFGALHNTKKITADPQMLHEKTHLLAFNPQKKHVIRLNSIMEEKYQKLCRHSKKKFSSNWATWTLGTVFDRNLILDFWEVVGVLRLLCVRIA